MNGGRGIIALTGASGFVGGHALRALLDEGWRVHVLVRDPQRFSPPAEARGRVEVIAGVLEDAAAAERLLSGAGALLHVAGIVRARHDDAFFRINAEAAARLAEAAKRAGVARMVLVSSLAARAPHLSAYAASKRRAEEMVRAALADGDAPALTIVRPPAVYGPGDRATLSLFDQLTRPLALLPGHGRQRLSLVHAADLGRALATLARTPTEHGAILEIDDGRTGGYSWAELADLAARTTGRRARIVHLPRSAVTGAGHLARLAGRLSGRDFILSPGKARELYHDDWVARSPRVEEHADWTARLQFAEGFRDTLAWYVREGWLPARRLPAAATAPPDHAGNGDGTP